VTDSSKTMAVIPWLAPGSHRVAVERTSPRQPRAARRAILSSGRRTTVATSRLRPTHPLPRRMAPLRGWGRRFGRFLRSQSFQRCSEYKERALPGVWRSRVKIFSGPESWLLCGGWRISECEGEEEGTVRPKGFVYHALAVS